MITPDTTVLELVGALGYPEDYAKNSRGFDKNIQGYRWELKYLSFDVFENEMRIEMVAMYDEQSEMRDERMAGMRV